MPTLLERLFNITEDQSEIYSLLRATPIFQQLSLMELKRIESILHERVYNASEIVFEQGEEGLGLYVIRSGHVRVSRLQKGRDVEIARLSRGSFFGELALLDGSPRAAQAQAVEKTELIGFFRPELLQLFETHPAIAAKVSFELAKWIGHRLRETLQRTTQITTVHVP